MQCMEVWGGNRAANAGVVMPGLDAWVYCEPHGGSESGGDVHYVSSCASGRITRFLLADVRGHGEPVSEIAISLRNILRRHINLIDQTTVVEAINEEFKHLHEVGMLATAVAGTFFLPRRTLTLSNAGHPPPFVYRQRTRSWEVLETQPADRPTTKPTSAANIPLGILARAHWEKIELPLRWGDMVLIFTDSLIEVPTGDGDEEQLGMERLLGIVRGLDAGRPAELIAGLLEGIRAETSTARFDDDTSVLLLQANEVSTRLADNLLAPFRYLGDLLRLPSSEPATS